MIKFNIYLKDEDWVPAMGGWRCDALLIPGANFEALYHDGMKADTKIFNVENHIIRWSGSSKPKDILVTLSLAKDLPKLEEERLQLERDKLNLEQQLERDKLSLEQQKASVETKWKIITALGAIFGSLLTFGTTYLVGSSKSAIPVMTPPRVHTYAAVMSISENKCLESLTKSLANYGLQNVTPVRMGIYATRGSYNVFVGCNSDVKAVFLVVSGPDDSKAKKMREDIKDLLP
ncbi:MAG: hypothetical protein ACK5U2_11550 [Microcystis sp.]|jgi:hypothetical protein|uniref:hypothetical protein n=1 Tax=unclassified Microcystis TaxID=2643300 RepID=UPI0022CA62AE|nr:hypothetical protein [Microcystis sp. LE19-195.1E]MCZ8248244.1 hypothetical protein [Microcystis sp. LE19-195.1E]